MNARDARVLDREDGSARVTSSPTTFGLRSTSKILDRHLDRLAMVYVRQSSPQQVIENRESRERQYALAQFAQQLGWPAERVVIVDDDQGQSGRMTVNRSGFQRLMTEVTLNHVGIVLGIELSRLLRSNKDWHQLINVCGFFNTLLCDQDGVYDSLVTHFFLQPLIASALLPPLAGSSVMPIAETSNSPYPNIFRSFASAARRSDPGNGSGRTS